MATSSTGFEARPLSTIRATLLWTLVLGSLGTMTELLLIGHHESTSQLVPLVLLALAIVVGGTTLVVPVRANLRLLQVLMGLFVAGGLLGVGLHYRGNEEFELEIDPSSSGVVLVSETLTGATPVLAPGSLTLLGVVGLAYAHRHPLLRPSDAVALPEEVQS